MTLVIGIGNPYRGDDAIGAAVVEALADADVEAIAFDGDGIELMVMWQGRKHVFIVDAMQSNAEPGTVRHFDALNETLPVDVFRHSTHQFSVGEAVELARVLGDLPPALSVIGIEGADFTLGAGLSVPAAKAVQDVIKTYFT